MIARGRGRRLRDADAQADAEFGAADVERADRGVDRGAAEADDAADADRLGEVVADVGAEVDAGDRRGFVVRRSRGSASRRHTDTTGCSRSR